MEDISSSDTLLVEKNTSALGSHSKSPAVSNRKLIGLCAGLVTTAVLGFAGVMTEAVAEVLEVLIGSFMLGNSVEHIASRKSNRALDERQDL